jgi:hypothetical protein
MARRWRVRKVLYPVPSTDTERYKTPFVTESATKKLVTPTPTRLLVIERRPWHHRHVRPWCPTHQARTCGGFGRCQKATRFAPGGLFIFAIRWWGCEVPTEPLPYQRSWGMGRERHRPLEGVGRRRQSVGRVVGSLPLGTTAASRNNHKPLARLGWRTFGHDLNPLGEDQALHRGFEFPLMDALSLGIAGHNGRRISR